MRITEKRLRQLIRSVIKESQINEMESHYDMDSYMGASGHAKSISVMLNQTFRSVDQLREPIEHMQQGAFLTGLITSLNGLQTGNNNILDTEFLAGLGICVGAALWMLINNYLKSGNVMYAYKNKAERLKALKALQKRIERECPECMDDVSTVEENEY